MVRKPNTWREDDPPWQQIKEQERTDPKTNRPVGVWGKYLRWCGERPNQWFRSHALMHKKTAQQAASDIVHWKMVSPKRDIGVTQEDGHFEAAWGHAEDENMMEQWFIWVRWIPNEKVSRTRKTGKATGTKTGAEK